MSVTYKWASAVMSQLEDCQTEIARMREVISRAASHWIHLDPGVAWEGDIADAMAAAVAEIRRLRLTTAEVAVLNRAIGLIERRAEETSCIHVAGYLIEDAETLRGIKNRLRCDP